MVGARPRAAAMAVRVERIFGLACCLLEVDETGTCPARTVRHYGGGRYIYASLGANYIITNSACALRSVTPAVFAPFPPVYIISLFPPSA